MEEQAVHLMEDKQQRASVNENFRNDAVRTEAD